jgi:hypothetical protein
MITVDEIVSPMMICMQPALQIIATLQEAIVQGSYTFGMMMMIMIMIMTADHHIIRRSR